MITTKIKLSHWCRAGDHNSILHHKRTFYETFHALYWLLALCLFQRAKRQSKTAKPAVSLDRACYEIRGSKFLKSMNSVCMWQQEYWNEGCIQNWYQERTKWHLCAPGLDQVNCRTCSTGKPPSTPLRVSSVAPLWFSPPFASVWTVKQSAESIQ